MGDGRLHWHKQLAAVSSGELCALLFQGFSFVMVSCRNSSNNCSRQGQFDICHQRELALSLCPWRVWPGCHTRMGHLHSIFLGAQVLFFSIEPFSQIHKDFVWCLFWLTSSCSQLKQERKIARVISVCAFSCCSGCGFSK